MAIPLVLALWEDVGFGGRKRTIDEDTPNLIQQGFNDVASAVGVHPGPDYGAFKQANGGQEPTVGLFQDINSGGAALVLVTGAYPNIHLLHNFGDVTSSVQFNVGGQPEGSPQAAATISPIPLVVELYEDINFGGTKIVLIQSSANLGGDFGFNDIASSVRVRPGPNFTGGEQAHLFRDNGFLGGGLDLAVGDYPDLRSLNFNDVASSLGIDQSA